MLKKYACESELITKQLRAFVLLFGYNWIYSLLLIGLLLRKFTCLFNFFGLEWRIGRK